VTVARVPTPRSRRVFAAGAAAAAVGVAGVLACTGSVTSTPYTPYQGVDVPSSLATKGVGCGLDSGIAYFAAVLATPPPGEDAAIDSGCPALPDPSAVQIASFAACFTPAATFEQLDASGPVDVWIFAYAGATPANVSCTDPTCPLGPTQWQQLLKDQATPATQAFRTLKCTATPESGQHTQAFGCVECATANLDAGAALDGAPPSDSGGDGGSLDGSSDGAPLDGNLADGASLPDGSALDGGSLDGDAGD
jgi:hypothetical protein